MTSVTIAEVHAAQRLWGDGIVAIGQAYLDNGDYKAVGAAHVDRLYGYDLGPVLFKPTRAAARPFRLSKAEAISYFVTGVVPEDRGFALQPWSAVRFDNAGAFVQADFAVAMGSYVFTNANSGAETRMEYSFGYARDRDGQLRILLHHSSFPFSPTW